MFKLLKTLPASTPIRYDDITIIKEIRDDCVAITMIDDISIFTLKYDENGSPIESILVIFENKENQTIRYATVKNPSTEGFTEYVNSVETIITNHLKIMMSELSDVV